MVSFEHVIKDELGIHVRPAGLLAQLCRDKESKVTMEHDGKTAEVTKLFAVMALAVKCGDTVKITVEGSDEKETAEEVKNFLEESL